MTRIGWSDVGVKGPPGVEVEQTFEALEGPFDLPAQAIECQDVGGIVGGCGQTGEHQDNVRGLQGGGRHGVTMLAGLPLRCIALRKEPGAAELTPARP